MHSYALHRKRAGDPCGIESGQLNLCVVIQQINGFALDPDSSFSLGFVFRLQRTALIYVSAIHLGGQHQLIPNSALVRARLYIASD